MWNKIYFGSLAAATGLTAFLAYYAWSWLGSIGKPADALAGFEYWHFLLRNALWFLSLALLTLGTICLVKTKKAWNLWITFGFFTTFAIFTYFILIFSASSFETVRGLPARSSFTAPIITVLLIAGFGGLTFAAHFVTLRFVERLYPEKDLAVDDPALSSVAPPEPETEEQTK
ncbi:MAG: hypothetical protein IPM21_18170 [Acidobacteria bacterium]|nr:hypothetical protein [Acidobacteriota bacterium]